jgi:ATP-dependent Clp protease protease subunit
MTDGTPIQQPKAPKPAYGYFVGNIDQQAVQRIANALTLATNNGVDEIHLLFQTAGGIVGDGICIYNLFQTSPINICLYNVGSVASIGVIAYLGADDRKCTTHASFMIHKTYYSPVQATAERLQSATNAAILDDARIEKILHDELTLDQEKWEAHKYADVWLSADDALKSCLATELADFYIPPQTQIFYLGPP